MTRLDFDISLYYKNNKIYGRIKIPMDVENSDELIMIMKDVFIHLFVENDDETVYIDLPSSSNMEITVKELRNELIELVEKYLNLIEEKYFNINEKKII